MAVYLDNNASTALHPQVREAMLPCLGAVAGNASSLHRFGRLQRDAIEQAREQVAQLAGARAAQVIFTSGGTESNNLLLRAFSRYASAQTLPGQVTAERVAVSAIEHMSLLQPAQAYFSDCRLIAVDADGVVDMQDLQAALATQPALVSVMSANNETGAIQPVATIAAQCREAGVWFHSDASQAAGKLPLAFNDNGFSAMTLSAHKFYGPPGAGALIVDERLPLRAMQLGGAQEKGLRAGSENVAAIVGMGEAARLAVEQLEARRTHALALREALEQGLKALPGAHIFAERAERLANTVQFALDGFDGETLLMQLDRKGLAVSSGSACTSGKTEPSHVLAAMRVPAQRALGAIRVSFGENNTMQDVDKLLTALRDIMQTNRQSSVMMAASL